MAPTMPPEARSFWRGLGRLLRDSFREPPVVFGIAFTDYFLRTGPIYMLRQVPHMFGDHLEQYLPGLTAKTLVLVGDRDAIVPVAWGEQLSAAVPGGILEVVHGPHVIMHTDPVMIAKHITDHADR